MKYRTVIEIICDGIDAENALNTAGEYLRGNVECGVQMNCRTMSFNYQMIKNAFISGLILVFIASVFVFRVNTLEGKPDSDDVKESVRTI